MDVPKDKRYWKKPLTDDELLQLLEITDEQAENSDIGGDSDADDDFDFQASSSVPSSSGSNTPSSSFGSRVSLSSKTQDPPNKPIRKRAKLDLPVDFSDYDSDDSVADKTYRPDSPTPLQNTLLFSDSDNELSEVEELVEEFSTWTKISVPPTRYTNFIFSEETGPKVQVCNNNISHFIHISNKRIFFRSSLKTRMTFLKLCLLRPFWNTLFNNQIYMPNRSK